jgi:hypothetical protein
MLCVVEKVSQHALNLIIRKPRGTKFVEDGLNILDRLSAGEFGA